MKKEYINPVIEIIVFSEDLLTASSVGVPSLPGDTDHPWGSGSAFSE